MPHQGIHRRPSGFFLALAGVVAVADQLIKQYILGN